MKRFKEAYKSIFHYSAFNRKERSGISKKGSTEAVVQCSKKVFPKKKCFRYKKDFRGTYNIYKLLK